MGMCVARMWAPLQLFLKELPGDKTRYQLLFLCTGSVQSSPGQLYSEMWERLVFDVLSSRSKWLKLTSNRSRRCRSDATSNDKLSRTRSTGLKSLHLAAPHCHLLLSTNSKQTVAKTSSPPVPQSQLRESVRDTINSSQSHRRMEQIWFLLKSQEMLESKGLNYCSHLKNQNRFCDAGLRVACFKVLDLSLKQLQGGNMKRFYQTVDSGFFKDKVWNFTAYHSKRCKPMSWCLTDPDVRRFLSGLVFLWGDNQKLNSNFWFLSFWVWNNVCYLALKAASAGYWFHRCSWDNSASGDD